ncbi:TonB-dependent receptor [Flavobacterium sp. xlx-214]|uniref:TonB-dependent receptor n=1 Tax=unclassified Flavobacterium TaxID=196869 RepID=UPI0013CF9B07|nr:MULTISPECIES: TonB-dependent receptor [unclassified Flavobacterium]MBA5792654.1 TonB-dependent receptor [Flavobacterium sp. xlx-221]QMI83802.1 TonB-dependent receptor [Flavobacterium sp. xlx-214]
MILTTHVASAQYKIFGKTYDDNGQLVPNASVLLVVNDLVKETQSNTKGDYLFENIPVGSYQIIIKKGLYEEYTDVTVSNQNVEVDLYLISDNAETMDDLVIHVESVKSKLEKEGFAMNVIETKDAAVRNIQTNELLDRTAGVRVRQNGGLGAAVDYNLNGMTGNAIKIFVDGLPISTYGSSFDLNSIPPALIERIEVYKGVVPIHLSDDALGGAINVVLKKGLRNAVNASLSYGSFNTFQANYSGMFRNNKSGLTFKTSGFHNYSDNNYEIWGKFARNIKGDGSYEYVKAKRFNDAFKSTGLRTEIGFTDVKWADNFFVGLNLSEAYNEIQHGLYMTVPYKGRYTQSEAQVFHFDYKKKNLFVNGLTFDINGMLSKRQQIVSDTVSYRYNWYGEIAKGLYGEDLKTTQGAQQGAPTLNHINRTIKTLRAGLSYEFVDNHKLFVNHVVYDVDRTDEDQLKPISQQIYATSNTLQKNITSFAYDFKAFDEKLKVNAFLKLYEQKMKQIQPTSKLVEGQQTKVDIERTNASKETGYGVASSYLVSPSVVVLFSAERALRLASEREIFGDPSENMISNTGLKPEISENYNLGLKFGAYKIKDHTFSVSASGFIRDTQDKIVRKADDKVNAALETAPFINVGRVKSIGFETELMYTYKDKLTLHGNVSRFNSINKVKTDNSYNEQIPNEPFFTANASLQYQIKNAFQKNSNLFINYAFGFVESFYTIQPPGKGIANRQDLLDEATTPQQFIQDIGFSYTFPNKKFIVSFDAKNIFNKQAFDNFAVQKPGRAFYFKINYSFNTL